MNFRLNILPVLYIRGLPRPQASRPPVAYLWADSDRTKKPASAKYALVLIYEFSVEYTAGSIYPWFTTTTGQPPSGGVPLGRFRSDQKTRVGKIRTGIDI